MFSNTVLMSVSSQLLSETSVIQCQHWNLFTEICYSENITLLCKNDTYEHKSVYLLIITLAKEHETMKRLDSLRLMLFF